MPPYRAPQYPKELTDKWWQSNKGLIAKIATKDQGTGIGKKLTALQTAFAKLDWAVLDPERWPGFAGNRTPQDFKEGMTRCANLAKAADPVYRLACSLELEAKNLAGEWSRNKNIPKSSVKAAQTVSDKAKLLSYALASGTIAEHAKLAKQANEKALRENQEKLRTILKGLPAMLRKIEQDCADGVSVEKWPGFWKQDVRAIGTMLPSVTKLHPASVPVAKTFQKHSNKCNPVTDQKVLDTWLNEIKTSAEQLEQFAG